MTASSSNTAIPVVNTVSPATGSTTGGITVIITGAGFTGATGVSFGSARAAAMTVDSDTQITAASSAGAGTVDVTVATPAGTSATGPADQFTYTPAALAVTGVSPAAGIAAGGTTVIITGSGFTGATNVSFGGASAAAMTVDSGTQITAASPAGAGTVDVTVATPAGTSATGPADQFTYTPTTAAPVLTGIFPDAGIAAGGTTVIITGSGFTGATNVSFGGASAAAMTVDSDTQITATTPVGAGTVDVTVTTPAGASAVSPAGQFTYAPTPAAPVLMEIFPDIGTAAGGTPVTLIGLHFAGATDVRFGAASAAAMTVDSDSQITATSPPGAGTVYPTVTTPGGASHLGYHFTYVIPAPRIDEISPARGTAAGGITVTITGAGFTGATGVSFGGASAAAMTVDSDTQITATSPAGAGTVDVTVTTPGGTSVTSVGGLFTYTVPVVTAISPASGGAAGGTTVIITGAGFTGATGVGFGHTYAGTMTVDSDTQITATSPASTGTVNITVTTPAGTSAASPAGQFTCTPAVTGISAASGSSAGGTTVTITGAGFSGATGVSFGASDATTINVDSDAQITATSPAGTGTVNITVTTGAGTSAASPAGLFSYTPAALAVTSVSPASGGAAGGTTVTVTGAGFSGATGVSFGGASAVAMTVDSDTQITATSPAGTGTVNITVITPAGASAASPAGLFTYAQATAGPPQITGVRPTSGDPLGGTLVTVSGSGFSPVTSAVFGAQPATQVTVVSDTELTVLSPSGAGAVDVRVVSAAGVATATAAFSYDAAVTVDVVRPDDLLLLQFEFSNGAVDPGPPLQVIPLDEAQPLLAVVSFPPLHIAETDLAIPAPGVLPPAPVGPIPAAMSGTSRLVFTVPPGVPLRLDALLDWSQWALIPPAAAQAEAQPLESALELPYRLIVSTGGTARWQHSIPAAVLGGISELWHTDLDLTGGTQPLSIPWSLDLSLFSGPAAVAGQPPASVRAALVQAGQATIRRLTLSGLGAWSDFQLGQDIQGGSAAAPSSDLTFWHQVTGGGRNQLVKVEGTPGYLYAFGFRALLITITERQVLVASDGTATETLCTTQSLAVTKAEIDFSDPTAAGLPYQGRGLPFTKVRLVTTTVPDLNPQITPPNPPPGIPTVSNQKVPVQFHMVATDLAGREVDLVQPLLFVADPGQAVDYLSFEVPPAVLTGDPVTYLPPPAPGSATLPTSAMSFTLQQALPGSSGPPFVPTMAGAQVNIPAVGQLLKSAGADASTPPGGRIPGQATIAFHPAYLSAGLGGASNAGQIFAQFVPGLDGLTNPLQPPPSVLPLSIPADRAGGLASPNLPFDGLSSSLGPVAGSNDLVTGSLSDVFAKLSDVNLLGLINLSDVFAQIPAGQLSLAQLPAIAHQEMPGQLITTFDWSPPLAEGLIGRLLELLPDTTLTLHSKTVTPIGDPAGSTFTLSGTLATFALNFINGDGTVRVQFDHLSFQAQLGQKIDLSTGNNVQISFGGMLAFVNELANLLPAGGFSDPPFLTVTADGLSAGYTLAIPSAGVGILSLENVSITAALDLPFNGPAGMRFAFAERYHTFLATVSLIAGGGYFAVEVDAKGVQRVEGALELGADLTVDLVIVSASVHVIAGFYFSYDQGAVSFDGYLRIGGNVSLAGIASISVELVLSLAYNTDTTPPNSIVGSASVTVSVSVLMLSTSFTFSASKRFPIPGDGTAVSGAAAAAVADAPVGFTDLMTSGDFAAYCGAFA